MKKKLKTLLKIILSVILILFVVSKIDTNRLIHIIKESNPYWLFVSFIIFNISKVLSSIRLNLYFKDLGINLSELRNLKLTYLGMFYNLFLPGGIGGDGYKIYLLKKRFGTKVISLVNATLLDRISGLAALLFLFTVLFNFSSFSMLYEPLKYLSLTGTILIYPVFIYLHKTIFKNFLTHIKKTTLLGFIVQSVQLISAFFIIKALPQNPPLIDFLTLFLVSSIVAILPLTIGGVGARELTFLYGLSMINQNATIGIAFSFIFFIITLSSSAIGIFFIHQPIKDSN